MQRMCALTPTAKKGAHLEAAVQRDQELLLAAGHPSLLPRGSAVQVALVKRCQRGVPHIRGQVSVLQARFLLQRGR